MSNYNYPVSYQPQSDYYQPQSDYYQPQSIKIPQIVYMPQTSSPKINRSVSVIAIILIIALLFVGMNLINNGAIAEKKVTWVWGYLDTETGLGHDYEDDLNYFEQLGSWISTNYSSRGMFTSEGIPVKNGVKIEKAFESNYSYLIYCYDVDDSFIGCYGDPLSSNQKLTPDDFTGELFSKTVYIRLFAYPMDELTDSSISGGSRAGSFTKRDFKRAQKDFTIYVGVLDI